MRVEDSAKPAAEPDRMDSHQKHLGRGFNWLGGATIVAKVIDFSTMLAVLLFMTKEQVGIAALVVSIGMIIEAFDGLGASEALVQARSVSQRQLDSLFWFVVGAAALIAGLTVLAAPAIEAIFGVAGLSVYFLAVAIKQPIVGAALIPLAIMNRDLQYERIAIVNVCATLAAALTRIGLAVLGAGAWALVAGYAASGLYILIGAMLARPFWPRLRFQMSEISQMVRFGMRAATANIFEQIFKNVDFLLVGWFYGAPQLAIYRVAFDVAMEPAMAVGTLVNRTALPVFARISAVKKQLAEALTWSLRRLAVLTAPLMVGLILVADPLMAILHDERGESYAAAALPLKLLAAAALLRATSQLLYPVMLSSGRPGMAARLSATTMLLLSAGILVVGFSFPASIGIIAVAALWLALYPLLLVWGVGYLRRRWDIRVGDLARPFIAPAIGVAALVIAIETLRHWTAKGDPRIEVGIVLAAILLTYAGLFLHARLRPYRTTDDAAPPVS